jgi:glycine/D-amino acid oxidase-like deaminating enzyme
VDSDSARRALSDARPACYWLDRPERPAAEPPLEADAQADLAIVGAGFTGLWAASLALDESPGRDVVLLEATRVGEGASGRNGGFVEPTLTHGLLNGLQHFPDELPRLQALGRLNLAELLSALERDAIDARVELTGKLEVATGSAWVPHLREYSEALLRCGETPVWLDRDAVRAELASPTYQAGVFVKHGGGVLDPARLCWGLQAAARRRGVRIFEGTPVLRMRRAGAGLELVTPRARLRARRVLLATNAYRSPLRRVRRRVIPVWDYALMSEPLSPGQKTALGWKGRQGVGDVTNQFHYYRLSDDDRILWGGYDAIYHYASGLRPEHEQRGETFAMLARHFFETFPQLEGLRFSHRWGGPIATTTRFCLDAGRSRDGRVAWAGGYTGQGVAASRFGARVALDLLERPEAPHLRLRIVRRRAFPWPPEPLRYLVVQLTRRELARADRNGGRRGPWLRLLDALGLGYDS